jgi:hypothetical protein
MGFQLPIHLDLVVVRATLRVMDLEDQPIMVLIGGTFHNLHVSTTSQFLSHRAKI